MLHQKCPIIIIKQRNRAEKNYSNWNITHLRLNSQQYEGGKIQNVSSAKKQIIIKERRVAKSVESLKLWEAKFSPFFEKQIF